jgi:hypothetical protein
MGSAARDTARLVVLYTSGAEPDWPDYLDPYTGAFTYFGDNRSPSREPLAADRVRFRCRSTEAQA